MDHSAPVTEAARSGSILQAERVRQGLSIESVAERLRLRPYQIEALESGEFSRLPQGTFLRGFMKNYARLLGVSPDRILAALDEQVPGAVADPGIVVPSQNIRYRSGDTGHGPSASFKSLLALTGLVVVAILAAYFWISGRSLPGFDWAAEKATAVGQTATPKTAKSVEPTTAAAGRPETNASTAPTASSAVDATANPVSPANVANTPTPAIVGAAMTPGAATVPSSFPNPSPAPTSPASPGLPTGELPPAPPLKAGDGNTTFTFGGKSWLQIKDPRGRVIHQREHDAGTTFSLDTPDGASMVLGNARNVRMLRKNREIELANHTDVNVARLRLE